MSQTIDYVYNKEIEEIKTSSHHIDVPLSGETSDPPQRANCK